ADVDRLLLWHFLSRPGRTRGQVSAAYATGRPLLLSGLLLGAERPKQLLHCWPSWHQLRTAAQRAAIRRRTGCQSAALQAAHDPGCGFSLVGAGPPLVAGVGGPGLRQCTGPGSDRADDPGSTGRLQEDERGNAGALDPPASVQAMDAIHHSGLGI